MDKENNKKDYEISWLSQDEKGTAEVRRLIGQHGGEILLEGPVERIALAYPIEKQQTAHFGFLHFSMEPAEAKALEGDLVTNGAVMRFLIVTPPFVKNKTRPPGKPRAPKSASEPVSERKPAEPLPLSNEALEKKIEEILQQ